MNIPLANYRTRDKLIWNEEEKGEFTVKSCYRNLMREIQSSENLLWTKMWSFRLPPKVKTFFWQTCSNCLPTADHLRIKHVQCSPLCHFCFEEDESSFHLFVNCSFSKACWSMVEGIITEGCSSFLDWIDQNFQKAEEEACCLLIMVCWNL